MAASMFALGVLALYILTAALAERVLPVHVQDKLLHIFDFD